tara:strand:+ start:52 stop:1317 length:1266 start_codon:yes stop_codon:yes gene_type:complete
MALTQAPAELLNLDSGITISTADNSTQLTLTSTDADSSAGPVLELFRNSGSPADNDATGLIYFYGENDNDEKIAYGQIYTQVKDASDGTEDGSMAFYTMAAGTSTETLSLVSGNVGIGCSDPEVTFEVDSGSANTVAQFTSTDAYALIKFKDNDTSTETTLGALDNDMVFRVGDAERMRIGSNGRVGIGTTGPRSVLDVVGNHAAGYIITAQNDGNNINRYGIKIIAGSDDSSGTSYLLDFFDGDGTNVGSVTNAGGTVSYGPFTAHHPCVIPDEDNNEESTESAYPYGTLLETTSLSYSKNSDDSDTERGIIYNVQKSSGAYSRKVLGAYGNSMNQGPEEETNKHQVLILGDGHILCNNEKGNISVGDGICTSTTAGIGMKADKMAMIIGIAQEDVTFSGSETKLVAVQYGLQQFTPWTD